MSDLVITGGAGPLHAAAIVAALVRLDEEQAVAAGIPDARPGRGQWALSTMPRAVSPAVAVRHSPVAPGWSVTAQQDPH